MSTEADRKTAVLIVTRDFTPYCSQVGWMIRMVELSNYLVKNNCEVFVIAMKRDGYHPNLLNLDDRVKTRYLFATDNIIYRIRKAGKRILSKILKTKTIDAQHLDLSEYKKEIQKVIKEQAIDKIIISSPPCSLRLLSIWLKKKYNDEINVYADYRDSWTLRNRHVKDLSKNEIIRREKLEQETLQNNDLTIFVSSGMLQQYQEKFSLNNSIIVQNGYIQKNENKNLIDEALLSEIDTELNKERLTIGYFGSGSITGKGHKDFRNLINVINTDETLKKSITLLVAGSVKGLDSKSVECKLVDVGVVNNQTARSIMELIDIGMVVHSEELEAPAVMGGKLYDYIASNKPIWFIVPDNATSINDFLKTHKKGYISDIFSTDDIRKHLIKILEDYQNGSLLDHILNKEEANSYSRENQYSLLLPYV